MPDDLRWSWYHHNRNKVHNKCNEPDSSWNHSLSPTNHGTTVFHKTGPWWGKKKKYCWGTLFYYQEPCFPTFPFPLGCVVTGFLHRFYFPIFSFPLHYLTSQSLLVSRGKKKKIFFFSTVLKDLFLLSLPGLSFQTHKAHHSVVLKAWTALLCPLLYYSIRWILLRGFTADTQ